MDLEVTGELPTELRGSFLRNGPNPMFEPAGRRSLKGFSEPVRLWSLGG